VSAHNDGVTFRLSTDMISADNAIPIEGWINDPTDNDLLHLIPLLEALQYVTDVRALLALRRGEADV
jgi:TFIIF-interacting CTD phosphatase-like protein